MDKNEYNLKLQEIEKFVDQGNTTEAARIADQIEWKRVRNVRTLCLISEIYEAEGRYEESKQLLLRAYKRAPVGRTILYRLVEVTIHLKQFDEAIEYYSEYVQAAPHDVSRYILKYKIYRGRGSSVDEQIEILKEYLQQEYSEKYAYELAKLYQEADRIQECLTTCDDLVLWFHSGKYVIKALELKARYAPLTPKQQEIYDHRFEEEEDELGQEKQIVGTEDVSLAETIAEDTERDIARDVARAWDEQEETGAAEGSPAGYEDSAADADPYGATRDLSAMGATRDLSDAAEATRDLSGIADAVREADQAGDAQAADDAADLPGAEEAGDITAAGEVGEEDELTQAAGTADGAQAWPDEEAGADAAEDADDLAAAGEEEDNADAAGEETGEAADTEEEDGEEADAGESAVEDAVSRVPVPDRVSAAGSRGATLPDYQSAQELQDDVARDMRAITAGVGIRDTTDPDEEAIDELIEESKKEQEAAVRPQHSVTGTGRLQMPSLQGPQAAERLTIDDILLSMGERGAAVREAAAKAGTTTGREQPEGVLSAVDEALLNMGQHPQQLEGRTSLEGPEGRTSPEVRSQLAEAFAEEEADGAAQTGEAAYAAAADVADDAEGWAESAADDAEGWAEEAADEAEGWAEEAAEAAGAAGDFDEDGVRIAAPAGHRIHEAAEKAAQTGEAAEERARDAAEAWGADAAEAGEAWGADALGEAEEWAEDAQEAAEEAAEDLTEAAEATTEGMAGAAGEAAGEAEEWAEDAAEAGEAWGADALGETEDWAEEAQEAAEEAAEDLTEAAEATTEGMAGAAGEAADEAEEWAEEAQEAAEEAAEDLTEAAEATTEGMAGAAGEAADEAAAAKTDGSMSMKEVISAKTRRMPTEEIAGRYGSTLPEVDEEEGDEDQQWVPDHLRGFFEGFLEIPDMDRQIGYAINQALGKGSDRTSRTGNVLIFGGHGCGKTTIARGLAQAIAKERGRVSVRMAQIYATDLNRKDIASTFAKIAGGLLIVEEAGDLEDAAAEQITTAMEFRTDGLIVVFEDEQRYLHELLMRHPRLTMKFTSQIYIPEFTADQLVEFGEIYANRNEFTLSDGGAEALSKSMEALAAAQDEPVPITSVKEKVDLAMKRANKLGRRMFGGRKRYDEDGRIFLNAKDFR